ncbi:MAG: DUF2029 domain-containing protein [Alphaproteobacteria bacterium]|nr:DUF2029 domain-containing protein [Alphaproteobacteria bacterium]
MTLATGATRGSRLDQLAVVAVVLAAAMMAFGLPPRPQPTDSFLMIDYGLNTRQALTVQSMAAAGGPIVYPEHFAYPPAFVVLLLAWLKLGAAAFPAWIGLSIAALVASLLAAARATGIDRRAGGLALAAVAVVVVSYAIGWDLKARNVNLVYLAAIALALVAAARRPALAGLLLSLSIAIKLYSVLFLPWLAWRRRWKWLGWSLAGLALWFVVLPGLWFGWEPALALTRAWWTALGPAGEPAYQAIFPGYLVSLHRTVAGLMPAAPTDVAVIALTRALQLGWIALLAWMIGRGALPDAAEAALLVLAPLPLGPVLQPHHAAVMLLPAVVVLAGVSAPDAAPHRRWTGIAALAACFLATQVGPGGPWRGAGLMTATVILALAVGLGCGAGQRANRL